MKTFIVKTAGPKGPRGARPRGHVFVVVARDQLEAEALALRDWRAKDETVSETIEVVSGETVAVGGF